MSVWYNMSANARLSCQEIKTTEYTFIGKNYVKFLLLWHLFFCLFLESTFSGFFLDFGFLFPQTGSSTSIFALPGPLAFISILAGPA